MRLQLTKEEIICIEHYERIIKYVLCESPKKKGVITLTVQYTTPEKAKKKIEKLNKKYTLVTVREDFCTQYIVCDKKIKSVN